MVQTAWILNDQGGDRQAVFQALGFTTTHYQHDLHSKGHVRYLLNKLEVEVPSVIWVRLGGPNCGTGNKHDTLRAEHLCSLAERQQRDGRLVVLEANAKNLAWNLRSIQRLVEGLSVTEHAWCAHEKTLGAGSIPCNSLIRVATNGDLHAGFRCKCPQDMTHIHMRKMTDAERTARYSVVLRSLVWTVLQRSVNIPTYTQRTAENARVKANSTAPMHTQPESIYLPKRLQVDGIRTDREDMLVSHAAVDSETMAKRARLDAQYDFQTCLQLLSLCKFVKSARSRAASSDNAHADAGVYVFGLYKHGNYIGVTSRTYEHSELVRYLNAFCKNHFAEAPWTSISLNDNVQLRLHRDSRNLSSSSNQLIGLGGYRGGEIWVETDALVAQTINSKNLVYKQLDDGTVVPGQLVSCKHRMISFSPRLLHCTEPWDGQRITVALYCNRAIVELKGEEVKFLASLGFPCQQTVDQHLQIETLEPGSSFPTEGAIRYKEMLKAGHKPKSKVKRVEQHKDDLGDCLDSILACVECTGWTASLLGSVSETATSLNAVPFSNLSGLYFFWGNRRDSPPDSSVTESFPLTREAQRGAVIHVIELFGGEGRTSYLCSKLYGLNTGENYDAVNGYDLSDPKELNAVLNYIAQNKPLVVVMSPPCGPFGPISRLNRVINPQTWQNSRREGSHLAAVCAKVAEIQIAANRHYLIEQPKGSDLWKLPEWTSLAAKHPPFKVSFDQCMLGLRMPVHPFLPIRKPTEVWASHQYLIARLQDKQCSQNHEHAGVSRLSDRKFGIPSSLAQVWPLKFCKAIAVGIADLAAGAFASMFPSASSSSADTRALECPGCRWHKRKDDPTHIRVGDCKYPGVEPKIWGCVGCKNSRPRVHADHTLDDTCQWAVARSMPEGAVRERMGQHPRDPRIASAREPTAAARLSSERSRKPSRGGRENSGGSGPARRDGVAQVVEGGAGPSAPAIPVVDVAPVAADVAAADGVVDAVGVQADVAPDPEAGWTRFDLGHALQMLRSVREAVVRRTLRKLHIRWYHCSSAKMKALLAAAGVDSKILALVPEIVDTCAVCRAWARPGPSAAVSTRLPVAFNEEVQVDLLFIERKTIIHMIDVCTRFTVAHVIPTKETDDLLTAIQKFWVGLYGPPSKIVADQEGGLNSPDAAAWLSAREIVLEPKAKYAHANVVERHHEILRRQVHLLKDQTLSDGVRISFDSILAESVFAKKCFVQGR